MPVPVINVEQMRQWEAATWVAGQTEAEVMRRAGQAVAARAKKWTRPGEAIVIVAGKGHNGEDARRAAEALTERTVHLVNVTNPESGLEKLAPLLAQRPALVIDGLFGIGLNRPLDEKWINLIEWINLSRVPVLAVDVPSGLNADNGKTQGAAIRATVTLTLGAPKRGLLAAAAWPFVGRLEVAPDIGLLPCPCQSDLRWTLQSDFSGFPPPRPVASHKGGYGHLVIVAGSLGYHGAAVLATRGALRAMPGLVTLFTAENCYQPVASQLQSAMVETWLPGTSVPDYCEALLFGPGLAARDLHANLKQRLRRAWLQSPFPMIADASALDWVEPEPRRLDDLRLLTPHPGEAARMLGTTVDVVQNDRPAALRELSRQWSECWVVLKGHQTLMGRSTGEIFVNSSGNPGLAQGGSGDVLAGYLGGLMVQPALRADPLTTLRYGVWQHGGAADFLAATQAGWTVENLVTVLGSAPPG